MKKTLIILLACLFSICANAESSQPSDDQAQVQGQNQGLSGPFSGPQITDNAANQSLLPSPFPVYTDGKLVINHPAPGLTQKMLPTNNDYTDAPGCYLACFSHLQEKAIYQVGPDIYVLGQVRVPGSYNGRKCVPTNLEGKDTSKESILKTLCSQAIPACAGDQCWAGGDTGGWFGIQ